MIRSTQDISARDLDKRTSLESRHEVGNILPRHGSRIQMTVSRHSMRVILTMTAIRASHLHREQNPAAESLTPGATVVFA